MNNRFFFELQSGDKFYRVNDVVNGKTFLYTKLQDTQVSFRRPISGDWMAPAEVNAFISSLPGCYSKIPAEEEVVKVD